MRFGKRTMFAMLQAIMLLILLVHIGRWAFSNTTTARITTPYSATTLTVQYAVEEKIYTKQHMRLDIPYGERWATVRYLPHKPWVSRINSFMGIWAEPLAWWLFFTLGISMLLLTNNTVFSKGTTFHLQKRFPWISMDEYFPIKTRWFQRKQQYASKPGSAEEASKKLLK